MKTYLKTGILSTVLVLIMAFSTNVKAQLLPEFGIKGGINFATLNNADGAEAEYKTGVLAGAFVKLNIPASPIAVQPELLFVQYGYKVKGMSGSATLNYVQIPVLLKFGFNVPAAPVKPNVYFGPYYGINIKAESDDGAGNTSDVDDFFSDTDYGVVVGAGLDISKFRIGLRYTAGLANALEDDFEDGEKNGAIALTVGIAF